ncbi:MAG: GT4 family glycosyltransferase PelF [Acidobacteriia bacterium]|nr:GT4 family glycosyltransferase PelF [Terriglobia bacterium]
MKRYTILHTIETGGPGGAENVVLNLAARLDSSRFRSLVLLATDRWLGKKLEEKGIPTYRVRSQGWYDFGTPRAIASLVRRERVDLIHSHLPGQNFYSCIAGRVTGCKTAVCYHGGVELADTNRWKGALKFWWVRHNADAFIVVCDFVGEMLKSMGVQKEKVIRIHNGVDLARFNGHGGGSLRSELNLPGGAPLVGMVANLRGSKGYDHYVRAARLVVDKFPDAHFVSVGELKPLYADPLRKMINELRLEKNFTFLGFREDVAQVLRDLDIFVLSSTSEGFPLVILEAMAAGKPVVATRCGGPQEIVDNGRTGILVEVADPEALAAAISDLIRQPELARRLVASARSAVETRFSIDVMIRQYENFYENLCETSTVPSSLQERRAGSATNI